MDDKSPFRLDKKRVAITGAFGRVGKGISKCFVQSNCERIVFLDIIDEMEESLCDFYETRKKHLFYEYFDITDIDNIGGEIKKIDEKHGPIDVWINCAYPRTADWIGLKDSSSCSEGWRRNVDMQLNSYCISSGEIARRMAKRKTGSIINISSIYGLVAPSFDVYDGTDKTSPAAYSAIKAGIIMHSKWLASYYGKYGIRVNVICPGAIYNNQKDPFLSNYNKKTPLNRMAKPEEIGYPVVFLASDAASYVSGSVLTVDGGYTAV